MKKIIIMLMSLFSIFSFASQYNVFIDFGSKTNYNVENISHALKTVGINSLYSQGYKAHLTLYLTEFKDEDLGKIKKIVNKIAKRNRSFKITFKGMHATPGGWLFIDAVKSKELQNLSDIFVNELVRIRDKNAEVPDWAKNIPQKAASFKKYGSPNVYENFDPHITITTPADKIGLNQFFMNYPFEAFSDRVVGIGIAKANDMGQFKEIIHYVNLK